jgi:CheY-like chemotaxis protein
MAMARLVICEDEALIRRMIGVMLRETGHEVHFAADGEEGLALIARERPDVVFTDRWMPALDGFELCQAMKARPDLAHIPVVLVTASLGQDELEEAYRHGVADILSKPFRPADLRALVERHAPVG